MGASDHHSAGSAVLPFPRPPRPRVDPSAALRAVVGLAASLALGLGSAYYAVRSGVAGGEIANGPWRTSVVTGSPEADIYTRARVAVDLLLAISAPATLYYTAATDSDGRPLDASCDYVLEGGELPTRWWSLTSYGPDGFLIRNAAGRYSISRDNVARSPGGGWKGRVSRRLAPGNWLPSGPVGGKGSFTLTLRLFDPAPVANESPRSIALPRVLREACS